MEDKGPTIISIEAVGSQHHNTHRQDPEKSKIHRPNIHLPDQHEKGTQQGG